MKVIHTYPESGQKVVLMDEQRFPNGPLSPALEHQIEYLEWNIEKMRKMITRMPADANRQNAIVEFDRQKALLGKMKNDQLVQLRNQRNQVIKFEK